MKKFILSGFIFLSSVLMVLVLLSGCTNKLDDGKIPITTISEDAKKDFLQGRDIFEKLKFQESLQHFENALAKDN